MSIVGTPVRLQDGSGSYTAETGSNRIVAFLVATDTNDDAGTNPITGVTFGGVNAESAENHLVASEVAAVFFVRETNIPSGSQAVVVSYGATGESPEDVLCVTLDGRDQTTPVGVSDTGSMSDPYSDTLAGVAAGSDVLLSACGITPSRTLDSVTGLTDALGADWNAGEFAFYPCYAENVSAGDLSFTLDFSASVSGAAAFVAFAEASGGGGSTGTPSPLADLGKQFAAIASQRIDGVLQ